MFDPIRPDCHLLSQVNTVSISLILVANRHGYPPYKRMVPYADRHLGAGSVRTSPRDSVGCVPSRSQAGRCQMGTGSPGGSSLLVQAAGMAAHGAPRTAAGSDPYPAGTRLETGSSSVVTETVPRASGWRNRPRGVNPGVRRRGPCRHHLQPRRGTTMASPHCPTRPGMVTRMWFDCCGTPVRGIPGTAGARQALWATKLLKGGDCLGDTVPDPRARLASRAGRCARLSGFGRDSMNQPVSVRRSRRPGLRLRTVPISPQRPAPVASSTAQRCHWARPADPGIANYHLLLNTPTGPPPNSSKKYPGQDGRPGSGPMVSDSPDHRRDPVKKRCRDGRVRRLPCRWRSLYPKSLSSHPLSFPESLAPASRSSRTTSARPASAAQCSGV